jgi:PAS domain-containing protein
VNEADWHRETRVLILGPTRRDATLAALVFGRAGVPGLCCASLRELCGELESGAGAVLIPEEALAQPDAAGLQRSLASQPSWSDLPVLVLLGNVTVIERPVRIAALVSTVRAALRARQRQYQTRAHLAHIERSEEELRDFFDNATVGLHWLGPDGLIQRVNDAELAMLGYARD